MSLPSERPGRRRRRLGCPFRLPLSSGCTRSCRCPDPHKGSVQTARVPGNFSKAVLRLHPEWHRDRRGRQARARGRRGARPSRWLSGAEGDSAALTWELSSAGRGTRTPSKQRNRGASRKSRGRVSTRAGRRSPDTAGAQSTHGTRGPPCPSAAAEPRKRLAGRFSSQRSCENSHDPCYWHSAPPPAGSSL